MRRRRRLGQDDSFGASLADILTAALGCVMLMFLIAVLHVRNTLRAEQQAHESTQAKLIAEEAGHELADREKQVEQGKRRAIEAALTDATGARGQAQRALQAASEKLAASEKALAEAQTEAESFARKYETLKGAAQAAVSELDPQQASPVDVMLVIDGTRSMKPSLDATRRNLQSAVAALRVVSPTARIGVVVFRDRRELPALRLEQHPLTGDAARLERFLDGIKATSSGRDKDLPEWLCGGIEAAAGARFRPNAKKLMIVVSDAAAQAEGARDCLESAQAFRAGGGQIYTLSTLPRGYGKITHVTAEYDDVVLPQHQAIAAAGGGRHVPSAESDDLLIELLRAAFSTRTELPLEALREALRE